MKNTMKKIMGLLLVAVLLVSVVPFQALATEGDGFTVNVIVKEGDTDLLTAPYDEPAGQASTIGAYLRNMKKNNSGFDWDAYTVSEYKLALDGGKAEVVAEDTAVTTNATVYIKLAKKAADPEPSKPTESTPPQTEATQSAAKTYKVTVTVKDASGDLASDTYTEEAGQNSTMGAYLRNMAKNNGINLDNYTVEKYWIKNAETGVDGKTVNEDYAVTLDSTISIKLAKKEATKPTAKDYTVTVAVKDTNGKEIASATYPEAAGQNSTVRAYLRDMAKNHTGIDADAFNNATITINGKNTSIGLDDEVTTDAKLYIVLKATAPSAKAITVEVKVNKSSNVVATFPKTPENGESAKIGDLLTYGWKSNWRNSYDFDHAYCNGQTLYSLNDIVKAGNTVSIMLTDGKTTDNKFPYKVYLHVYLNNKIDEPDKTFTITKTLAADGVVSVSDVKGLIKENYKAKDSDGIQYDGLYLAKGNWVKDYVNDNKSDKLEDIDIRVGEEYVHINLMITNAVRKSTSTADSSNPKTGDAIFMTITVMGLSAAALTGMYFYDKKRKAL